MPENCPKCKKGKTRESKGSRRKVCDNCAAYWENGKFMGYLEKVDPDTMKFDEEDIERDQSQAD